MKTVHKNGSSKQPQHIKNSSSIEKGSDLEDVDFRGGGNKRGGRHGSSDSSVTDDEHNNNKMWNDLEEDINNEPKNILD